MKEIFLFLNAFYIKYQGNREQTYYLIFSQKDYDYKGFNQILLKMLWQAIIWDLQLIPFF